MRRFLLSALMGIAGACGLLRAQEDPQTARVRGLNHAILQIYEHLLLASPGQAAILRGQAAPVFQERAAALSALAAHNASQALSLAFSQDLLARLAVAFPDAAKQLEAQGVWQGPIEYLVIDDRSLRTHQAVIRMPAGRETVEIHFAGREPKGLKSSDILRVEGVRAGAQVAAAGGTITGSALPALTCSTTGVQNTAVLLVTFPDVPAPNISRQSIADIFFGASGPSLDSYWREASYGATSATGSVFGWYTLNASYTCDQYWDLQTAAIQAADADVNFLNYDRIFIVFPDPGNCSYAGLSTVGCVSLSSADGSFTASTSWLPTTYMTSQYGVKLVAHEGGHGLTLNHARSRDFGTEALGALGASGTLSEYGDNFSTMGYWNLGHYAAPHKAQLNWMNTNVQTVQGNGSFSLQPYEISPGSLQALKIQRGTGNDDWLWLEYRQPVGIYDSTLNSQAYSGALIHYNDPATGTYTDLLDSTPETSSWLDPALAAGQTWVDPYSNVSISVTSATPSALNVTVNYGPAPCVSANPTVSLSPANPSVQAGSSVNYTVTVANNDSAGCASSTFNLSSTQPSGWGFASSTPSIILGPGQSGSATLTETPPAATTSDTYLLSATAASSTSSGSGTDNCTVLSPPPPLSATISLNGTSFTTRSTVSMTATVLSGSSPAAGAAVTFALTKADGSKLTNTVAANSNGTATWSYKIVQKDARGIYSVMAQAGYNSQTAASSGVTFKVQ